MARLFLIFFILKISNSFCQNLVPNSSFENYSSCPTASGQLTLAINWLNPASSFATPDYFNACSSYAGCDIPAAGGGGGFQFAKSGNGMAGIWAFCINNPDVREYTQCQLVSPLVNNDFYLVEYYINRSNWANYACNNISCLFSNSSVQSSGSYGLLAANPQVVKFNNDIVIDTLNWVKISSLFQASGGENYITIGNFKNDASTTYSNVSGIGSLCAAYYYIDDVSVINITTPQWQYRDTSVVIGDSVLIGPAITGLNVNWYDMSNTFIKNAPGIYVKPTTTTSYKATETFNSATYNHTVTVTVLPTNLKEYEQLQNSIKLFPNPNAGIVNLKWDDVKNGEVEITVTTISGQLVYQNKHQIINTSAQFNLDEKNGVYFVKIKNSAQNKIIMKKIIIQK